MTEPTAHARIALPRSIGAAIVDHARRESPRECCGVIGARAGRLEEIFPLRNVAPGNTLYEIDPSDLFALEFRRLPKRGLAVGAIYHSHPASPAYPSPTDVALAAWPDATYLICSLADPALPTIRAFRIVDGAITEHEIALIDGP